MPEYPLESLSLATRSILCPPFEWCFIPGGPVILDNAISDGGSAGGEVSVADFGIARYPITNAQYRRFLDHPNGFANPTWWAFSPEGGRFRSDHPHPRPTAFVGDDLPRTRVSWFDGLAFCRWLSSELKKQAGFEGQVYLPTEAEWQRAALGDSPGPYPWGAGLDETRANYANHIGQTSPVGAYPTGESPYGVQDLIGNVWERLQTAWGSDSDDPTGYVYRAMRGGAWNVSNPEFLYATGRAGHPPRGMLNDAGFRCALAFS